MFSNSLMVMLRHKAEPDNTQTGVYLSCCDLRQSWVSTVGLGTLLRLSNTNVQHGHGVAGAGLGLLVGGPHAAGSVGHGEGEAGGGGGKYGGEDGEDEQETAEPTQAYWVVCRSEWPVLHWADPACQYSEMKAFILEENKLFEGPFIISILRRRKKKFRIPNLLHILFGALV